jgi:hypothetical protein
MIQAGFDGSQAAFLVPSPAFLLIKVLSFTTDKNDMYINSQSPPILTLAVSPEISMQRGTESQPLKLEPYQIVQATVAEGGLEKVVLNLKHHRLEAETKTFLRSGQNLSLQVLETQPRIQFRIIENSELNHIFRFLHSLNQNIKVLPLIEAIQTSNVQGFDHFPQEMQALLSALILLLRSNPGKLSGKDLSRLWDKLGLNLEALLSAGKTVEAKTNLKTMLLMHAIEIHKQGGTTESIENVLDLLKLFQLCRYSLAQENLLFLPLPFSFLEQGYLLAEKKRHQGQEDNDSEQFWKMTLHLKLSFLGDLQILCLFENLTLCLRILCDSKDKVEIISDSLSRLGNHLSTVSLDRFSVGTGAKDPLQSLIQRLAPDGDHFLKAEV